MLTSPVGAEGPLARCPAPIDRDEARPEVSIENANKVVGRVAFVSGRVLRVGHSASYHFLNFDDARPGKFTVVIPTKALSLFPGSLEDLYEGRQLRVRGLVTTHRDKPQIQVTDPAQIEVVDAPQPDDLRPIRRVPVGDEITIATFNILNLFDAADDLYHQDETTKPKPREQMQRVASVIRSLNADVLALQEVESRGYLERFVEVFLADVGYEHVVHFEGNDLRGIDVCLLSRIPVGLVRSYRHATHPGPNGGRRRFERDLLCVEFQPPGAAPFEVWVVHLKSNYGGRPYAEPIRIAEAVQIRRILDERLGKEPETRIVLCGDFNDTWESTALRTIVGAGPNAMHCFFDEIIEDKRITYNQEPHRTMIDFVLASPAMARQYVKGSYAIVPGSVETAGSDHNPVLARFRRK